MRQFRGVGQSGSDVVDAKSRIARQDFILGGALGKTVEDHRDRNSGPGCTDLTATDLWDIRLADAEPQVKSRAN